jgi:hypothetical protein
MPQSDAITPALNAAILTNGACRHANASLTLSMAG